MKEIFETKSNNDSRKRESVLNDWDRKYLTEGSKKIIKKIYKDFGNNFPDVILLPETAARPLYYLFSTVFKKIEEKKNIKSPKFVFFNTNKNIDFYQKMLEEESGEDIKTTEEFWQKIQDTQHFNDMLEHFSAEDLKKTFISEGQAEDIAISRENMKARAEEIKKLFRDSPRLAIIDDFISNQNTDQAINKAFGLNIPAYGISGFEGNIGNYFEAGDENSNPSTGHWNYSYTKSDAIGVKKSLDNKYALPIKLANQIESQELYEKMKELRKEMKQIGEDIAKGISEELG